MNVRFALRSIKKDPLLATIAILSLGLGIGANTAIFSLIDQLLLRMLPVENPRQLVQVTARGPHYGSNWGMNAMSYPMYKDVRDKAEVFSGVLARFTTSLSLGYNGQTELVQGELVTGNYFQVLGVKAALGRTFVPDDDVKPGDAPLAMLTYDFWQSRFAADPDIAGKIVHLNGYPMAVVGVSAPRFQGVEIGEATQVFVPMMMQKQMNPSLGRFAQLDNRRSRWANVFARLKPGITREQAKAGIAPLYSQIVNMELQEKGFEKASEYSRQQFLKSRMEVFEGGTGRSFLRQGFTTPLYVLMAITGLVLLIACANVANLLIARATARQKEIAVRLALGASRRQIISQLMMENLVLSMAAAVVGVVLGYWIDRFLLNFLPGETSQLTITADLDIRVLGFSVAVAFVTAFIFGLVPALQATRPQLSETLKSEAGSVLGGHGHNRFRKALVVAQVSLSLLLLIASSLFVRSLANLHKLDPGFRIDRLITFSVDPALNGYSDERTQIFYRNMLEKLQSSPGVESAAHASIRVLDGSEWDSSVTVEGYKAQQGENMNPHFNAVSPGYFATMGIPLLAGRDFTVADAKEKEAKVCIVNETFARKYFPQGNAVGHHIGQGNDPGTKTEIEIVGVIGDAKYDSMRDTIPRQVFLPYSQGGSAVVYVRTTQNPSIFFGAVRAMMREIDPNLPIHSMRTLQDQVARNLITERMIASLSGSFGFLATILAVIGLYGVMSFSVARRSREIGIRVTLGARPGNVVRMVMREVGFLLVAGVVIAIPAYIGLSRFIRSQLYGIDAGDPLTIVSAATLLLTVGLIAGYIPSRRAVRVDPIKVLRHE